MAAVLLHHMGDVSLATLSDYALSSATEDSITEILEQNILESIAQDADLTETEKLELRKSRRGQGRFRKNVEAIEQRCRISHVTDKRLLIASHIKPWRACETNLERLDGNNGLLLIPTFDLLCDKGYMTFDEDGSIVIVEKMHKQDLVRCGLPVKPDFSVGDFSREQQRYLDYHRYSVFLG